MKMNCFSRISLATLLALTSPVTGTVRAGEGPTFVEARTYRFVGHSRSDPGKYRPEGELEEWQARDPLVVARERLRDELHVPEAELDEVAAGVERELTEVEQAGLQAPFPEPEPFPEFKS